MRPLLPILLIIVSSSVSSSPALASLGGSVNSVVEESAAFGAVPLQIEHSGYTTHEIGIAKFRLHEFSGHDGKVFAVAWCGKTHPDLATVMGDHFRKFRAALAAAQSGAHGRRSLEIDLDDFHLEMSGRPMAVCGRAWFSKQVPAGVSTDELR